MKSNINYEIESWSQTSIVNNYQFCDELVRLRIKADKPLTNCSQMDLFVSNTKTNFTNSNHQ